MLIRLNIFNLFYHYIIKNGAKLFLAPFIIISNLLIQFPLFYQEYIYNPSLPSIANHK